MGNLEGSVSNAAAGIPDAALPRKRRSRLSASVIRIGGGVALLVGMVLVPSTTSSSAPTGAVTFVDYSQCANGAAGSEAAADADDCIPQGWLNGIMQASNSHFREGDVTPQRALLDINTSSGTCTAADTSGCHSITLRWQARKGTTHAYDSLATWNRTVVDANRCQDLTLTASQRASVKCGANGLPTTNTPDDTLPIEVDNTEVDPVAPGNLDKRTSAHDLNDQRLEMYGGDLVKMTAPTHDAPTCSNKCADDYATSIIYYAASAGSTIELLFGGHLGVSPVNRGGWGVGLGASNINGGPYHIKWEAADGASIGKRDNQIMGSSIQPLAEPNISTLSSPQTAIPGVPVTLTDQVTLVGATDPTGTARFSLRPAANDCSGTEVLGLTTSTWTKVGGGTGTGTWQASVSQANFTFTTPGTYYWIVSVDADNNNTASGPHGCGESTEVVSVAKLVPGGGTTILLDDAVTITGSNGIVPTGTVTFDLYQDDATCADPTKLVYTSGAIPVSTSGANAVASTTANTPTVSGSTYFWNVTYSGDSTYEGSTPSACAETAAIT
jgi:hypothetical protein